MSAARTPSLGGWLASLSVATLARASAVSLVAQVALTDYGAEGHGQAVFWLAVGLFMLWLVVHRRSRAARAFIVVTSCVGAVLYAFVTVGGPSGAVSHSALLALLYLGQAVPLLMTPIRDHVGSRQRADLAVQPSAQEQPHPVA